MNTAVIVGLFLIAFLIYIFVSLNFPHLFWNEEKKNFFKKLKDKKWIKKKDNIYKRGDDYEPEGICFECDEFILEDNSYHSYDTDIFKTCLKDKNGTILISTDNGSHPLYVLFDYLQSEHTKQGLDSVRNKNKENTTLISKG